MTYLITVAAAKGGVGKTTLAYELSAALDGCLVDLDWDAGGATRMWGFDPSSRQRAPLLDAFEKGPEAAAPRSRRRPHQPLLVPSHPDLSASRIDADLVADCLVAWAPQLAEHYVVVDTHPGANPLTDGAVAAADLVVIPAGRPRHERNDRSRAEPHRTFSTPGTRGSHDGAVNTAATLG